MHRYAAVTPSPAKNNKFKNLTLKVFQYIFNEFFST